MTGEEFNAIFRERLPEISRFLARRLPHEAVEDMASDLFEIAWSKREKIPAGLEFPWLIKTARYLISNFHRKQQGRSNILATLREPVAAPSAESIALADMELASAWRKISEKDREVLALWALEGLEPEQISAALGLTINAANIRLTRARQNLLANFEKDND